MTPDDLRQMLRDIPAGLLVLAAVVAFSILLLSLGEPPR